MFKLKICGFIFFNNPLTNYNGIITVKSYTCDFVKNITSDMKCSEYSFCKQTLKLLNRNINDSSHIPYTLLLKLVRMAIIHDKINEFNAVLSFSFNSDFNPVISVHHIQKFIFPLPLKNMSYMTECVYGNITNWLFGQNITSNLASSVACDILNNLAVNNGIIDNRLFEFSCGRLFVNISFASKSLLGRKMLKCMSANYKQLSKHFGLISKIGMNRRGVKLRFNNNAAYSNNILKLYTSAVKNCCSKPLEYYVSNPDVLSVAVNDVTYKIISSLNIHSANIPGTKPSDFAYLGIDDVFKTFSDADFRFYVANHISLKRKIYNANKRRNINCIKSDGTIY